MRWILYLCLLVILPLDAQVGGGGTQSTFTFNDLPFMAQAFATTPDPCPSQNWVALVPILTGDVTFNGIADSSGQYNGDPQYEAWYAFDGDDTTYWEGAGQSGIPPWYVTFMFSNSIPLVHQWYFSEHYGNCTTNDIVFSGGMDGTNWTQLDEYQGAAASITRTFANTNRYLFYQWKFVVWPGCEPYFSTLQVYGCQ